MNRELLKLKKVLLEISTPSKEHELCMALRTILHDSKELNEEQALNILGWSENPLIDTELAKKFVSITEYEGVQPFILIKKDIGVPPVNVETNATFTKIVCASEVFGKKANIIIDDIE